MLPSFSIPIDDDHRRRYPRFVRPVAPRNRFASPGAKLIWLIGRRPRTSLTVLPSAPGLPTRAVSRPLLVAFHLSRRCASPLRVDARPSFRSRTQCCPPQPIHACGDRGRSSSWAGVSCLKDDEHESNDGSWNACGNARSAATTAPAPPMYDSGSSFALLPVRLRATYSTRSDGSNRIRFTEGNQ